MKRIPIRILNIKGRRVKIPLVKLMIINRRKVLVPLKRNERVSLNVLPYWNHRGNKLKDFKLPVVVKSPRYTIPIFGRKRPIRKPLIKKGVKMKTTRNQELFLVWTKKTFPKLYHAALLKNKARSNLQGMGGFFDDIIGSITDLAPAYLSFKNQKDLMKMQLKRAEQGLPPANVADYTPVIKTQVELAPATRSAVVGGIKDMIMPLAIGGGILLVILAMKKKK